MKRPLKKAAAVLLIFCMVLAVSSCTSSVDKGIDHAGASSASTSSLEESSSKATSQTVSQASEASQANQASQEDSSSKNEEDESASESSADSSAGESSEESSTPTSEYSIYTTKPDDVSVSLKTYDSLEEAIKVSGISLSYTDKEFTSCPTVIYRAVSAEDNANGYALIDVEFDDADGKMVADIRKAMTDKDISGATNFFNSIRDTQANFGFITIKGNSADTARLVLYEKDGYSYAVNYGINTYTDDDVVRMIESIDAE